MNAVTIGGKAWAAQMNAVWDKSRPFVWAVGGHVIVLSLLCLNWSRAPAMRAAFNADNGSMSAVEATLVTAPSPWEDTPAKSPTARSSTPPLRPKLHPHPATNDSLDHQIDQSGKNRTEDPPPSHGSNDARSQASSDQGVQLLKPAEYPSADAPQQSSEGTDDPYAEMRRQRAEAERQHQLDEMNLQRTQHQQTAMASSNVSQLPPTPPDQSVESSEIATWFTGMQQPAITSDFYGSLTFSFQLRSARCPFRDFQSSDDGSVTDAWIDCLMNPADGGTVNERNWLIEQ